MKRFEVIIVDDEPAGIIALERVLNTIPSIEIIATTTNGHEAIIAIEKQQPDIVFLDIEMPECNGFDIAEATKHLSYHLVFVTAYHEHAVDAFTTKAIDYLLKPARPERVRQCIDKILLTLGTLSTHRHQSVQTILIGDGQQEHAIDINAIAYIESLGRYQRITFNQQGNERYQHQTLITEDTLESFCKKLEKHGFIRIHRSYLINLTSVQSLKRKERNWFALTYQPETEIPVARNRIQELKDRLSLPNKY